MEKHQTKLSKQVAHALRHTPEEYGLELDANGWCSTGKLMSALKISRADLDCVVENNEKKRFTFSPDKKKIRAAQGHSVEVDLKLEKKDPPSVLYHGTITENLSSILKDGIVSGKRQYVHLSSDMETATVVGSRHGKSVVILTINTSGEMDFYQADNGVWLARHIPPEMIADDYWFVVQRGDK